METTFDSIIKQLIEAEVKSQVAAYMKEANSASEVAMWKPFYTNQEIMEMLDVDPKTLRNYRNEGLLGFTQQGSKYYYSAEDIQAFMKNGYHRAFNI